VSEQFLAAHITLFISVPYNDAEDYITVHHITILKAATVKNC